MSLATGYTANYAALLALDPAPIIQPARAPRPMPSSCGCQQCRLVWESINPACRKALPAQNDLCCARDLAVHKVKYSTLLHRCDPGLGRPIVLKEAIIGRPISAPLFTGLSYPATPKQLLGALSDEMKYEQKISGIWSIYKCPAQHKYSAPYEQSKKCPVCYLQQRFSSDKFIVVGNKPRPYNAFHWVHCKDCGLVFCARRGRLPRDGQYMICGHHEVDVDHCAIVKTLQKIYDDDFSDYCIDERGAIILSMFIRERVISLYSARYDVAIFFLGGLDHYRQYAMDYCKRHEIRAAILEQVTPLHLIDACDRAECLPELYVKKANVFSSELELFRLSGR